MLRISAVTRITLGLACLTATVLLLAQGLGVLPNTEQLELSSRKSLCEAVAIPCCLAAQREDLPAMRAITKELVTRNEAVLSAAVRRCDGTLAIEAGPHARAWGHALAANLPGTHVSVPIYERRALWGSVEVCFRPLGDKGLFAWMGSRNLRLIAFVTALCFLVSWPYLRRVLRHLDPSRVIPARVRATLDTLAEGVLILDADQRIVLANKAFATKIGHLPETLQGLSASRIPWSLSSSPAPSGGTPAVAGDYPWQRAIREGISQTGVVLGVASQTDDVRTLTVNAMPILGGNGERRGVLATFDDITVVERQNIELERMLTALRESRDEVQRQNKELYLLAARDPLTRCLNRRSFFESLEQQWAAARRHGRESSVIMVDVDHFKRVNDQHGHRVGDEVLQQIAAALNATARKYDLVGRYGGEEFCILLPDLDLEAAAEVAERHRAAVEALRIHDLSVTISLGVAGTAGECNSAAELLEKADQCLYLAKRSGRNRVERADRLPESGGAPVAAGEEEPRPEGAAGDHFIPYQAVNALCDALAYRDMLTAEHCRQVAEWCAASAQGLLSPRQCYVLEIAGLLHDIGKVAIPDSILLKPSHLTDEERRIMATHDRIGVEILASLGSRELSEIVRQHHAWYDGKSSDPGMPRGKEIALGSRLLAICDAFAAMVADRVYRKAMTQEAAFGELRRCAGTQFDPELVEHFVAVVTSRNADAKRREVGVSKQTALMIGLQIDRLTLAWDTKDFGRLSLMAGHLAASAASEGMPQIAELAGELELAAANDPQLVAIVRLITELLEQCRWAQHSLLAGEYALPADSATA